MRSRKNILKSMLSVSGVVVIAKVLGFVKQIITANIFGATIHTDIIFLAEGVVSNLDYLLVQALSTAFIPIYLVVKEKGEDEGKSFASNTIKFFFVITLVLSSIVFLSSPIISRLLAPSYAIDEYRRLSLYLRLFAPVLILIVELAIFNSLLKANEQFVPGELIGVNQSVILIILALLIGEKYGPDTLVIAFYTYAVFNLLFLMIISRRFWCIKNGISFVNPDIEKLIKMMGPLLLGYSVVFVNQQVDKIIVSGFEAGTVTAMNYASVLSNFVTTFIGSICAVLFTYITQNIVEGRDKEAASLTSKSIIQLSTLAIPISTITIINANDIVRGIFGRGKFDEDAVSSCSIALVGYAFMFVPFVLRELYSRFQYGYEDSKRPMINSTIAIVLNMVLSIALSKVLGVLGVTLATSFSVAVCGLLNYYSSKKRNNCIKMIGHKSIIVRWILGIGVCIAISILGQMLFREINVILRFVIIASLSLTSYGVVTLPIIKPLLRKFIKK